MVTVVSQRASFVDLAPNGAAPQPAGQFLGVGLENDMNCHGGRHYLQSHTFIWDLGLSRNDRQLKYLTP